MENKRNSQKRIMGGIGMNYKSFQIKELFDIHPTKAYKLTNPQLFCENGKVPVVTNTSENYGRSGYSNLEPTEHDIITFSDTGTKSPESFFFQEGAFIGYSHVQGMYPYSDKWGKNQLIYLAAILRKKTLGLYDYSTKMTRDIISNLEIELPIVSNSMDEIDFDYMESYICRLEQNKMKELDAFLAITRLNDCKLTTDDELLLNNPSIETKTFTLGELFVSSTGDVDLQQKDINGRGVYFINSGIENSGIKGKTDKPAIIFPANTITIDFWGYAFYRDFEYKLATHNHVFSLSGDVIKNRYVGLYLVSLLSKLPSMFSYNNMATWTRLKPITIELPITSYGNIDYDFMENYIKVIEKKAIRDVIDYKNSILHPKQIKE